ncbi:DNA polymerase III subunit alpha [Metamycoplasma neophronis]|uniref:DNA-directed DNA polymerase n=1 Tax=Metamycoplasma neophronis TaxID=872983 RepID=A0ABY2Z207_9BACT|nr:DNA polymerase III subunit alpha [Metamycoplasma neophronis]
MKLTNLHLNTTFSFLESCIQPEEFINEIKKNNLEYFAVTEHCNFYSMAAFLNLAKENNLKPVFGLDCNVKINNSIFRYLVYAKNLAAFENLKKLSYEILKNGDLEFDILNKYEDLIWVEHPIFGFYAKTKKVIERENYYFAIQTIDLDNDILQSHYDKCLLVNHNAILNYDDNSIINVLAKMSNDQEFVDIYEAYQAEYDFDDEKLINLVNKTNEFIKSLYFEIPRHSYILPTFPNPDGLDSFNYLQKLLSQNIAKKFANGGWDQEYTDRLKYELSVIETLKFSDYFLIIQDWIQWAKNNNISIGPGRGSAAGSLISYLLGITEVDPIKFGLIFERFLNPKRVTMPDIDVDVQDDRRGEVINYLINKYGFNNVANIVTFASLGKKSAIRDVLRVYNVTPSQINSISKLISTDDSSLLDEFKNNNKFALELAKINKEDSNIAIKILNEAARIAGFYRQTGTHAAGIVISPQELIKVIPTQTLDNQINQTQVSMEYLESFGLIKMDILGLKTLTTIKEITNLIKLNQNIEIDLNNIPYDDAKALSILNSANTAGIFQVETPIMVRALQKIGVSSFDDIVAIISLNRPGPAINIPKYAKRKQGLEVIPSLELEYDKIVKPTYGIIIYQEQIMQIVQAVAKMSFSEADMLRRIISKKKVDQMEIMKEEFISKAVANNYNKALAKKIFDSIEKFADYGFNKSHAVSYSILTFQMAYLKAHYPLEFYAACISSAHGAHETIAKYANEAKKMGIKIISPDINLSEINAVIKDNAIILPLTMIKGIGPEIVKNIIANRNEFGPYKNFLHFMIYLLKIKSLGLSTIELLIKANALRNFGYNQATLLKEISKDNSDTMLLIKVYKDRDIEEISSLIDKYSPTEIINQNIDEEKSNEISLLGQSYNVEGPKLNLNNQVNFSQMHEGTEHKLVAQCTFVKSGIAKTGKVFYRLDFQDESQKFSTFVFYDNPELMNLSKKIVELDIVKKNDNTATLKGWKIKE